MLISGEKIIKKMEFKMNLSIYTFLYTIKIKAIKALYKGKYVDFKSIIL